MDVLACQRCKLSTNGPQAFLLTCRACSRTWHHRCHQPAVEDEELIGRIRATNAGGDNDLRSWTCRRCGKKSASATPVSRETTAGVKQELPVPETTPATPPSVVTASHEDVEMDVDVSALTLSEVTSQTVSLPDDSDQPIIDSSPANSSTARDREARPDDDDDDDDPEDLYGPPVERRVIRILPSLAEELREQRRRAPVEKERRTPLATDWIGARHAHDPSWKPVLPRADGRRRRKPAARKLGDSGLNVDELLACYTVEDWLREHKA